MWMKCQSLWQNIYAVSEQEPLLEKLITFPDYIYWHLRLVVLVNTLRVNLVKVKHE